MNWAEIGKWIVAVIAAIAAVGVAIKLSINRKSSTSTETRTVVQANNRAGRDIVGGDSDMLNARTVVEIKVLLDL